MGLELKLAQTVAIGAFNPAIITPDWLHEEQVCDPEAMKDFAYPEVSDGTAFYAGGFEWDVNYDQLTVSTVKDGDDCGQRVEALLDKLRHTPVEAVGHNFHYVCPASEWRTEAVPRLGPRSLEDLADLAGGVEQVRWDGRFGKSDGWVEVTLIQYARNQAEYIVVLFNHHHSVQGQTAAERSDSARGAARKFAEDRQLTATMIRSLFGSV